MIVQEEEERKPIKQIYLLCPEQIDYYWKDIIEGLRTVPNYFEFFDEEWTRYQVKNGHLLIWALSDGVIRGIVITRILIFPRQRVFNILALYGCEMLNFFNEMEDAFVNIAKKFKCTMISAQCRPGLKRLLKGFHVEHESIVLYRNVPQVKDH